jgi:hypothetical protein
LLHVWIDIHSKSLRRLLRSCSIGRVAGYRQNGRIFGRETKI